MQLRRPRMRLSPLSPLSTAMCIFGMLGPRRPGEGTAVTTRWATRREAKFVPSFEILRQAVEKSNCPDTNCERP